MSPKLYVIKRLDDGHATPQWVVHTTGQTLAEVLKLAGDLHYDVPTFRRKLIKHGRAKLTDDVGELLVVVDQVATANLKAA